ncbi:MAG: sugar phosphate nucleotidyltransferase [Candidatus Cloacimonadales bacterium]
MKKIASIILAAGKGTRMKSEKPKVIFDLAAQPMINRVISTAERIDSDPIVVVVGYKKDEVIATIPANERVKFVEQKEQNGTGHAVMVTAETLSQFSGDIFVLCGDVPLLRHHTLQEMLTKHRASQASCTVLTAMMDDALRYGRIVRNSAGNVERIVEFKDASPAEKGIKEINTGIYCFDSKALFDALQSVSNNNNQNEYYLTDTLEILNQQQKLVTSVLLADMVEASGVNSQEQLTALEKQYLENKDHYDL